MERIRHKIGKLKEHLAFVRSMKDECLDKFNTDKIYRGALLHYFYLLADGCLVLAELVIKDKGLRIPQTYAESIDILGEGNILDRKFAYDFAGIAGLRNFLAHDYEKVEAEYICRGLMERLVDIDAYILQIEEALGLR